ncbi:AT hook motif DNA-binding family protein [Artemisia annua]|uniref:AT hook motif DNA-binding family protein n=1 Tax=Artemisia annua TaxID=35608 RepID=A0A2U1KF79_ARTAN|nr:AT hook motif DNA-binding family protein [Artemisia annua]
MTANHVEPLNATPMCTQANHITGPISSPSLETLRKKSGEAGSPKDREPSSSPSSKEHMVANHVEPLNATPRRTQATHIIGPSSSLSHETLTESSGGAGIPMNKGDDSIPHGTKE